jgi:RNA polymerase sigma-70 factor (ECF subfamily)
LSSLGGRLVTELRQVGLGGGVPADASGFADWVRPHLPAMARLAARVAPDADRDDVVQESLVRAWRKRRLFDPGRGTPSAWLLAITADRARRARVRSRSRAEVPDPWQAENDPPPAAATASPVAEDRVDLARALDRLSPRQRLAVDCVYYAGLTVAETAAVMRCADGTVKSTLADARSRLRSLLEVPE